MKTIPLNEIAFSPISAVDSAGRVFLWNERLFRAIPESSWTVVKEIFDTGIIHDLVARNLFPRTILTDLNLPGYAAVVEHERLPYVTYPYEWSFSMLKAAALVMLEVNELLEKRGYQMKDCHPFNVVFDGTIPKFVDLGSISRPPKGYRGWYGYRDFLNSFLYPLVVWHNGNSFLARRMLLGWTWISHYEFTLYNHPWTRLLPASLLEKVSNGLPKFRNLSLRSAEELHKALPFPAAAIISFLNKTWLLPFQTVNYKRCKAKVQSLKKKSIRTAWSAYHAPFQKGSEILSTPRFDRVVELIRELQIESVVELASNRGVLSRLLLERCAVKRAACVDSDEEAINGLYNDLLGYGNESITPAVVDLVHPLEGSWTEPLDVRLKSDAVVALAFTHHLILSAKLTLDDVLDLIARFTKRYAVVEFMPLGLFSGVKPARPTPDFYHKEWFREGFARKFEILHEEQLEENRIVFVGECIQSGPK